MRVIKHSLLAFILTVLSAAPLDANGDAETSVKAAIVQKISKFVSWPPDAVMANSDVIRFCVAGDSQMLSALNALSEERVHGRRVVAVDVQQPSDTVDKCDVLYFGDGANNEPADWIAVIASQPMLTFALADGYGGDESIVRVRIRRNKVRFEINLDANKDTGLRIGGQLLQLAAAVGGRGG